MKSVGPVVGLKFFVLISYKIRLLGEHMYTTFFCCFFFCLFVLTVFQVVNCTIIRDYSKFVVFEMSGDLKLMLSYTIFYTLGIF